MEYQTLIFPIAVVITLVAMSAFFSGSETGLTSITKAKIHKLKMDGNRRAIILSKLREDKEGMISAILIGNNVVNIGASAIATGVAIQLAGDLGVLYSTTIMTLLVLIFAEVLPKTYAVRNAESVALMVAPAFVWIIKLLKPLVLSVQFVVKHALKLMSHDQPKGMTGVEVLKGTVDMYHKEGDMEDEDRNMFSGIFDLETTEIREIMLHRSDVSMVDVNNSNDVILKKIAESKHSRLPVWEDTPDNVIGVLHVKDVLKVLHQSKSIDFRNIIREPWFVPEATMLKNQLRAFRERKQHMAIVVDEFGGISGIITLEDIIEEVVGEIHDEYDTHISDKIKRISGDSIEVDGDISIRDFNRDTGWTINCEDATTISGLVMILAQQIPKPEESYESEGIVYKVMERTGVQLNRIEVKKLAVSQQASELESKMKKSGK